MAAPAPEIPGYYFDPEKKKYFKIEKGHTAPTNAAWSSANVKRRKQEAKQTEAAIKKLKIESKRVRHARVLQLPLTGGFLAREFGLLANPYEVPFASFARGLRSKGYVENEFDLAADARSGSNLTCIYVNGSDEKTGLGTAYVDWENRYLRGYYIERDENNRVIDPRRQIRLTSSRTELVDLPDISDIKYHEPSHSIITTSKSLEGRGPASVQTFSPPLSDLDEDLPHWKLGSANILQSYSPRRSRLDHCVYSCTPAPAAARDTLCALATAGGVILLVNRTQAHSYDWVRLGSGKDARADAATDAFSVDFVRGNHNLLLVGSRAPGVSMVDLRQDPAKTPWMRVASCEATGHVRSVNEHQFVAAGIRNQLALFDARFAAPDSRLCSGSGRATTRTRPVLNFEGYRNRAHLMELGFAVDAEHGLVAAAHDDGRMALYSLRSGRRVRCADVDGVRTDYPIKAVVFATLPRDRTPTLFAGIGQGIELFSFDHPEEW